ncbi:Arylsulfatase [Pontiella sulfatireligans]|uniref:Arylsulfatase n=2 Tax=Pontiella sulfatireligans TaxID=2750658 RepID=A0A6C2UG83_9BACT|nr:sulfatase S1_30 [Kiritimatiellales bacterium]VGO18919.1 Arylsulfatase [Pontiella sulfatireligans]
MKPTCYFIFVMCLALNAGAVLLDFTQVGYTNIGLISSGSVVAGGSDTSTVYTVSGLDVDGDGTNDSFSIQIEISSGNGAISWDAGGGEYDHNGGAFSAGEEITLSLMGISGTASGGGAITNGGFGFDDLKVKRFQSGDTYSVYGDQTVLFTNADNNAELNGTDHSVTMTGVSGTWNLEYYNFTINVASDGPSQPPVPPPTANGKNLIWIITDEHNLRTLGCYRDTMTQEMAEMWGDGFVVETPHLDSMADNGTLFTRMHASRAVCTPSRASMFSGQYPLALGIPNNSNTIGDGKYLHADVTTIFDVLKSAGYLTGYVGKWHLSEGGKVFEEAAGGKWWEPYPEDDPNDTYGIMANKFMFNGGHDKWYGIVEGGLPATANGTNVATANGDPYLANNNTIAVTGATDAWGQPLYTDGITTNVKFATDWLTDRTIDFVSDFNSGAYNTVSNTFGSFFHVLSIPDPHTADSVREPYASMYTHMDFQLPRTWNNPNYNPADPYSPYLDNPDSWMVADDKAEDLYNPGASGSYTIQDGIAQYFGMVKCIDDNIGRLIQHLDDEGLLQDTILMFSADHGDLFGEHQRVNKGTPWDMSMRIPCIIVDGSQLLSAVTNNYPLVPRGMIVEQSGNNTDWMETFLSLLDVSRIPETHGRDLTSLFAPAASKERNEPTVQSQGWMASTDSRYKLVLDAAANNASWLFDLERDPKEFTNYIDHAQYEGVVRKLAQGIKDYMDAHPEDVDPDRITEYNRLLSGWTRYAEVYGLNPDQRGDEDEDGILDLNEYIFGSDPTNGNSVIETGIEFNGPNSWPGFTHRARHPVDPAYPYRAEWSTNLVSGVWNTNFGAIAEQYDEPGFITVERTLEREDDALYFRLAVPLP